MSAPQGVVTRAVYLSAIDSGDQTFAMADTPQTVDFDTLQENQMIDDLGNGEFQVKNTGAYLITCTSQVTKTIAAKIMYCIWLQRDTGSGFVDVTFSTTQDELTGIGLSSAESKAEVYVFELKLNSGDKIRLVNSTDNTDLQLSSILPTNGPVIPSSKIQITKMGRL